ncbi:MAG: MmcQ/YjbR family DNA-binding protein [Pseudomonadaceae bacterium]|nr:MmcQ/YjbR family DNA-binding protein [Pseudomonadaceae bacterium]
MAKTTRTISDAVRDTCLSLPGATESYSHGSPVFRINDRQFATYSVNHHGDGRVALILAMPDGSQRYFVESDPEIYFVPAYTGSKGWLGLELSVDLDWEIVVARVTSAARHAAKDDSLLPPTATTPPNAPVPMEEFDALQTKQGKAVLDVVRPLCLALPETSETSQWGNPAWKAGKKTFCTANAWNGKIALQFWVGGDHQIGLTADPRFSVPAYTGHNGWIELRANDGVTESEISPLVEMSYRHFALKRMLKALDAEA